ncbi:monovalent cation:H+ antiporter, CPA1 family [Filimonas lacunae]|uniref:Monovalent cation:H+ antiporter, CPA1 family n=1 Tax=Filimonas lacunae TaxID=477680 RepID=A0A1N7PYV8_9BACT|nr:cation:proton antiporter [Filimonas lacunae]SIT15808.1 monovalent cation:H+ antiporter, CPA1 family [Filimonas lacunae]
MNKIDTSEMARDMENYVIILILLGLMVILSALAERMKIAAPIVLIIVGIAVGFIPGMPVIQIDSEIIFLLFLPPLLYDASFKIHYPQFKANSYMISKLAFTLVFATTIGIAVVAHFLIPGMTWPLAFLLGSILAPTDAVAAINITKGLGLSPLTNTVLEGESLLNDASALVAFKFSLAALSGTSFVLWNASVSFVLLLAGGFAVGLVLSKMVGFILKMIKNNGTAVLSLVLLSPFVTYLVAEKIHTSGVIAVVTLGISLSRLASSRFPDKLKVQSEAIWDMITFLLNGLVFILIGLELPIAVKALSTNQLLLYSFYGFIITVTALVLRTFSVFGNKRRLDKAFVKNHMRSSKRIIPESVLLSIQESLIISWSGMRGIISLSLAIGLPAALNNGEEFPLKNTIIFITTVVVLLTIVGQGLILPFIVKKEIRDIQLIPQQPMETDVS